MFPDNRTAVEATLNTHLSLIHKPLAFTFESPQPEIDEVNQHVYA